MIIMPKEDLDQTLKTAKGVQKDIMMTAADLGQEYDTIDPIVRGDTEDMIIDEDVRQVIKNFWQWWNDSGIVLDPRGDSMIYRNMVTLVPQMHWVFYQMDN